VRASQKQKEFSHLPKRAENLAYLGKAFLRAKDKLATKTCLVLKILLKTALEGAFHNSSVESIALLCVCVCVILRMCILAF
jgi:hypothetical protein